MNDYLKFYIPFGMVAVATLGFVLGGHWVWLGIATFPLLAVFDTLLPKNMRRRQMNSQFWATLPVWLASVSALLIYVVAAWRLSTDTLTGWQIAGSVLSLMWISVVPGGPAAHELFVSASICIGLENRSLRARGYSAFNWRNRFWRFALAQLLFEGLIYAIAGWQGVAVAVTAMLAARIWVESFNYFQHYGLIRIEGAAIGHRHVWNHMSELSRVASFEITNHAGHHQDSYVTYHQLAPHQDAIPMPSLFICFFAALVPPIRHEHIIKPALKRWDLEIATAEERLLAREQNRRAGWPDWIGEAGEQAGRARTVGC